MDALTFQSFQAWQPRLPQAPLHQPLDRHYFSGMIGKLNRINCLDQAGIVKISQRMSIPRYGWRAHQKKFINYGDIYLPADEAGMLKLIPLEISQLIIIPEEKHV